MRKLRYGEAKNVAQGHSWSMTGLGFKAEQSGSRIVFLSVTALESFTWTSGMRKGHKMASNFPLSATPTLTVVPSSAAALKPSSCSCSLILCLMIFLQLT